MLGPQHPGTRSENSRLLFFGFFEPAEIVQDPAEAAAASERSGVLRPEDPDTNGQNRPVLSFGLFQPAQIVQHTG